MVSTSTSVIANGDYNMANYKKLIPTVLKWEGNYCGNIDGMTCTMKGVTLATFRKFYGAKMNCTNLRNITNDQWNTIFKKGFWDRWKGDDIDNQAIANLLVDWVWASGVWGIKYPQQVLGVKADGIVGLKTLAAINYHPNKRELFYKLWNRRKQHFEDICRRDPSKKKFLRGWVNRLSDFKYFE